LDTSAPAFAGAENLIAPRTSEFQLTDHPSVLIFSTEGRAKTQHARYVDAFLARLVRNDDASKSLFVAVPSRNPLLLLSTQHESMSQMYAGDEYCGSDQCFSTAATA
jgi:hypothetical protein